MAEALELLREKIKEKSIGKVAKDMNVSKSTVSLLRRQKYPNPQKMYQKVLDTYGVYQTKELIGVGTGPTNMKDLSELLKEIG